METWRLLDTPPMRAADNMLLDEVLLECKGEGLSPNTIRFLQFKPRAVLVGFHQSIDEEIRADYCRERGIEINRRVTGGGAIFFDENQLGWEIISDKAFFQVELPTQKLFKALCEPVVTALDRLGVHGAEFRPRNDIELDGRKISGTGGTESGDAFLFQGTMLVDFDVDTMLRALRIPVEKLKAKEIDSVKERVTCLAWELGYVPTLEAIKEAIRGAFEQHLGIRLVEAGLTEREQELFDQRRGFFHSAEWIDSVKPRYDRREVVQSSYKAEAGMTRYTLVVDKARKAVKDIYITGDFLTFPTRGLRDLEASLRGRRLDRAELIGVIKSFFEEGRIRVPGMSWEDFVKPLEQALNKVEIARLGLPLEHANSISVVNGSFQEVLDLGPTALLLPYCAKLKDCDLRYKKACRRCDEGGCTIGPAWARGLDSRMFVTSIVNYEDLWEELMRLKARGVKAYIGCCCQPFYAKHVDDFIRSGLPGILLDIDDTTCYELDQAKEAYAGVFESQTNVNLDLLEQVLQLAR